MLSILRFVLGVWERFSYGRIATKLKRLIPRPAIPWLQQPMLVIDYIDRRVSGKMKFPPSNIRFRGLRAFEISGREWVKFLGNVGLKRNSRVLDLGCGPGRIALPLSEIMGPEGSYEGIDIDVRPIRWCQRRFASDPHFHFQNLDVRQSWINPGGAIDASHVRLPFANEDFDFACLISLFTHMVPRVIGHYLQELHRVLKPGAVAVVTALLDTPEVSKLIEAGRSQYSLPFKVGVARFRSLKFRQNIVAVEEVWFMEEISRTGFLVQQQLYGSWSSRPSPAERHPSLGTQDFLVLQRR